jgi:hypothetical protein
MLPGHLKEVVASVVVTGLIATGAG